MGNIWPSGFRDIFSAENPSVFRIVSYPNDIKSKSSIIYSVPSFFGQTSPMSLHSIYHYDLLHPSGHKLNRTKFMSRRVETETNTEERERTRG